MNAQLIKVAVKGGIFIGGVAVGYLGGRYLQHRAAKKQLKNLEEGLAAMAEYAKSDEFKKEVSERFDQIVKQQGEK